MYRTFEGKRKNSKVFEFDRFEYRSNRTAPNGATYLRCTTQSCHGRAVLQNEEMTMTKPHGHPPYDESYFTVREAKSSMKRLAEESASALKDIFDDVTRDRGIGGELSYHEIESTLRKRRRKTFPIIPRTPREAADRLLNAGPEFLPYTVNFLDSVEAGGAVGLMFMDGGRESLEFFRGYRGPLYADGTFYITPQPFTSLLTVHFDYGNHTFPLFYCLLPNRTEIMYRAVFAKVAETIAPLAATVAYCMTDFEMALMKSCEHVFNVPTIGCWFHFSQALFKKVRKVGLVHRMRRSTGGEFRKLIHSYMALPLLPEDAIEDAQRELNAKVLPLFPDEQRQLQQFRRYISPFWIRKVTPTRMAVFGLRRRSNNAVESFNAALKRKIQKAHPNLYFFIENLNKMIVSKLSDLRNIQNNHPLTRRIPRVQVTNEETLRVLEDQLSRGLLTSMDFIRKVCARFHRYVDELDDVDGTSDVERDTDEREEERDDTDEREEERDDTDEREEERDDRIQRDTLCPICLTNPRTAVVNPCGHSACYQCADTIQKTAAPANKCHECRGPIASVIRVFGMG